MALKRFLWQRLRQNVGRHLVGRQIDNLNFPVSDQVSCVMVPQGNMLCPGIPMLTMDEFDRRLIVLVDSCWYVLTYIDTKILK